MGDFYNYGAQSRADFTLLAVHYAYNRLMDQSRFGHGHSPPLNITTVFIGADATWNKERVDSLPSCYRPTVLHPMTAGEDMCFGIGQCDSLVITASASTFGWWTGYLMRESWLGGRRRRAPLEGIDGMVFYNGEIEKDLSGTAWKNTWSRSNFPNETGWVPLRKVVGQGSMGTWVEPME